MANTSIDTLLQPAVTTRVVTQVAGTSSRLLNLFGMQPGGPNVKKVGHRHFGYDVFNDTRKVGRTRSPGASAAEVSRQKVGRVVGTFPRMNESIVLLEEETHNIRRIGGSAAEFDEAGEDYVSKQTRYMGKRAANFRTLLLAGMIRDSLYYHASGDDYYLDFTSSGGTKIDFKMPSGNKSQLNMLGGGDIINISWATVATAGVFDDLMAINAAFQQLYGGRLDKIICGSQIWSYVTNNTDMKGRAGSANKVFETFERPTAVKDDLGNPVNEFVGKLTPVPWIDWHIMGDEGLEIGAPGSESYTKLVGVNDCVFMSSPSSEWCEMLEGSEPVSDGNGKPSTVRMGIYSWSEQLANPARRVLYTIDNAMPALYVPNAMAYGTVVF